MANLTPGCNDSERQLLGKILLSLGIIADSPTSGPVSVQDEGVEITSEVFSFNFTGTGVTASAVGNDVTVNVPGGAASTLQSGSQNIGGAVDTISVVFPVAFASLPDVVLTISRPAAEDLIYVNIDDASLTVNGFTASLSATTGSANYKLKWMAN